MAQQSEGPQDTLMDEHTDAGIDYRQAGCSEQPNLDIHHVGYDQQDRPTHGGSNEGQTPPTPEDQAKQDQGWNHDASSPRLEAYAPSTCHSRRQSRATRVRSGFHS
jgi:hypothetical protein